MFLIGTDTKLENCHGYGKTLVQGWNVGIVFETMNCWKLNYLIP